MSHTIATFRPRAHAHNDVREVQVRRENGRLVLWLNTTKGPVLLDDTAMLQGMTARLVRSGVLPPRQETLDGLDHVDDPGDAAEEEHAARVGRREGAEQR